MIEFKLNISKHLSDAECANAFAGIPEETTHLSIRLVNTPEDQFGITNPRFISNEAWVNAMQSLSTKITHIHFHATGLFELSTPDLKNIFAAIPPSVTELNLSENSLESHDDNVLVEILPALHRSIKMLNLGLNGLGKRSAEEFIAIISALPPQLTELSLRWNSLAILPAEKLMQAFLALPSTLKSLDLRMNHFGLVSTNANYRLQDFRGMMRALPTGLTSLDLSSNFSELSPSWIAEIARALPNSLTTLKLDSAPSTCVTVEEVLAILDAMPRKLTKLDIGHIDLATVANPYTRAYHGDRHSLRQTTLSEWMQIFRRIPPSVTTLSIKNRHIMSFDSVNLNTASHVDLLQLFSALPTSVKRLYTDNTPASLGSASIEKPDLLERFQSLTELDLREDKLGYYTFTKLLGMFKMIPNTVTSLDLRNNNFEKISTDELIKLFLLIPASVTHLNLTGNPIFWNVEVTFNRGRVTISDKSRHEIDAMLDALNKTNASRVIKLQNDGEPPVARAFLPLMSAVKQNKFPVLVAEKILSYLFSPKGKKAQLGEVSTKILNHVRQPHYSDDDKKTSPASRKMGLPC